MLLAFDAFSLHQSAMSTLARSHCIARVKVFRLSTLSLCSTRSALVSFTLLLGRAGLRSLLDCKASRILVFLRAVPWQVPV